MKTISTNYLNDCEPCTVKIRGKVAYSHIARKVDGVELEMNNAVRKSKGAYPFYAPYSALTLEKAEFLDSKQLDGRVRKYFTEYLRDTRKEDGSSNYYGISFAKQLPSVIAANEPDGIPILYNRNTPLPGELKQGLDVTVCLSVYQGKSGAGIGISYVVVNEPIQFYKSKSSEEHHKESATPYECD